MFMLPLRGRMCVLIASIHWGHVASGKTSVGYRRTRIRAKFPPACGVFLVGSRRALGASSLHNRLSGGLCFVSKVLGS